MLHHVTDRPSLTSTTATELAALIRQRKVSVAEVVDSYLQHIATFNKQINAIVTLDAERTRQRAQEADQVLTKGENPGALHGIPMTIKDAFDTQALRTTAGFPPFADRVPEEDALLVSRLRRAGAIILGKTNLPALASGSQSDNLIFGRSSNPWNLACTPGGSSGGSAAAIAAGLSALELGSDIGGSIRIPAHFCGIYGLKMTGQAKIGKGHIASPKPLRLPAPWNTLIELASFGPLSRSIDDLELAFSCLLNQAVPTDDHSRKQTTTAPLRIACTIDFAGAPLSVEIKTAMSAMVEKLQQAGYEVNETALPKIDFDDAWELAGECLVAINNFFQPSWVKWTRHYLGMIVQRRKDIHPLQQGLYRGSNLSNTTIVETLHRRELLIAEIENFLDDWDVWVCPVYPTTAFTHRTSTAAIEFDSYELPQLMANLLHPIMFNVSGHPAVVIPIGFSSANMPIGVQIVGKRFGEFRLLEAARQIDNALNAYRFPPEYR